MPRNQELADQSTSPTGQLWGRCLTTLALALLHISTLAADREGVPAFEFKTRDVIALVGGANTVSEQEHGYLEVLLNICVPDRELRFRNLGWEGDTVYSQVRDLNFGSWSDQFSKAGATVILAQFGQMESLQGVGRLPQFLSAYENLITEFSRHTSRIVLVSPLPFETTVPPLPGLSTNNPAVAEYSKSIRLLALKQNLRFVNLFDTLPRSDDPGTLTSDGIHLNRVGHWIVASEISRQLSAGRRSSRIQFAPSTGELSPVAAEQLRQVVLAKDRLWFNYWRPMNWAFLAGDRTEQPSSRDHRDPTHRWFPAEMERFLPLINLKEQEIAVRADVFSRDAR